MPVGAWDLEYGCTKIADPNRVARYVANAQSGSYVVAGANTLAPYGIVPVTLRVDCGCAALNWTADSPGSSPYQLAGYTTPLADVAPWYSATAPESAHFWGWMVEKIEDLSTSPISRSVNDRASSFGGAALGWLRKKGRAMKVTLLGFGGYEAALDWGFRWITDVISSENEIGQLCDMTVRTSCPTFSGSPTFAQWDTGRWTFKEVGVVDGPRYEEPPTVAASCNVRRISFTVVAAVPYGHKCPTQVLSSATWMANLWTNPASCPPLDWICTPGSDKVCTTVTAPPIGEESLIIEIEAGSKDLSNVQIDITPNPLGRTCSTFTDPPCDSILISTIPSGYVLRYDGTTQRITVTLPGGDQLDGTAFLDMSSGTPPAFPVLRNGQFCICISSDRCSWDSDDATVSAWTVHRELSI